MGSLIAATVLVVGMLCVMAARVAGPFGQDVRGKVLAEHRLDVRERLRLHRRSIYALGFVLLAGAVTGAIPRGLELVGIVGAFAVVLSLPAAYRLTDQGIGFNRVVFRTWAGFVGTDDRRDGLRLSGRPGQGDFAVVCLKPETRERIRRTADAQIGQAVVTGAAPWLAADAPAAQAGKTRAGGTARGATTTTGRGKYVSSRARHQAMSVGS